MKSVILPDESAEVVYANSDCKVVVKESDGAVGYGMWGGSFTHLIYVAAVRNWVPAVIYMCSSIFDPKVVANAPSAAALQKAA